MDLDGMMGGSSAPELSLWMCRVWVSSMVRTRSSLIGFLRDGYSNLIVFVRGASMSYNSRRRLPAEPPSTILPKLGCVDRTVGNGGSMLRSMGEPVKKAGTASDGPTVEKNERQRKKLLKLLLGL